MNPSPMRGAQAGIDSLLGKTIQVGNYFVTVERKLGQGGFADVYQVVSRNDSTRYALKHFRIDGDQAKLDEVKAECILMKKLKASAHVLTLYAACFAGDPIPTHGFCLLELCNQDLVQALTANHRHMTEANVLHIFEQVCLGIAHMHGQNPPISHWDLKGENILQSLSGHWVICDLGSAQTIDMVPGPKDYAHLEGLAKRNTTAVYRAPELYNVRKGHRINTKVDIFSLGVLLYLMCFGRFPFEATPQATVDILIQRGRYPMPPSHHSPQTRTLITTMLHASPHDRPDIQQVLAVVGSTLRPAPVAAMAPPAMVPPRMPMPQPAMHGAPIPRAMPQRHGGHAGGWQQQPPHVPPPRGAAHVVPHPAGGADSLMSAASGHAAMQDPFASSTGASHGSADAAAGGAPAFNPYGDPFATAQQAKRPPQPQPPQQQQQARRPSMEISGRAGSVGPRAGAGHASAGNNSVASVSSNAVSDTARRREQHAESVRARQASARSAGVPAVDAAPPSDAVFRPESKINPFDDGSSSAPSTRSVSPVPDVVDVPAPLVGAHPRLSAQVHDAATAEEYDNVDTSSSAGASPRRPRESLGGSSSDGEPPATVATVSALDNPFLTRSPSPANPAAAPMPVSHPYVEDALRNTEDAAALANPVAAGSNGASAPTSSGGSASAGAPPPPPGRSALGASDKRSSFSASGRVASSGAPDARPIAPLAPAAKPDGQPETLPDALAALTAVTAQRDELQRRLEDAQREVEARGTRIAEMRSVIEALSNGHASASAKGAPADSAELESVMRALSNGGAGPVEEKRKGGNAKKGGFFGVPNSAAGTRAGDAARGVERAEDYVKATLAGVPAEGPPLAIGELRRCNSDIAFDWDRAEASAAAQVAAAGPEPLPQM